MSYPHNAHAIDAMDPHGFHEHDHGHVVVDWKILVAVLTALLFFTVLTVSAANFEKWISAEFDVLIPTWVNVFVAMSIAVVKATLVCLFFMQLIYDKFLNSILFLFCLLALGLFLGFSALDLGGRGLVNPFIAGEIQPGGDSQTAGMETPLAPAVPVISTSGENMITHSRAVSVEEQGQAAWEEHMHEAELHYGHGHHEEPVSSPDRAVPRHGLTPGLYDEHEPADAHGESAHDGQPHADDTHADEPNDSPPADGDGH